MRSQRLFGKNCLSSFGIDGFKDSFGTDGKDSGFKDGGFKDGGFKVIFRNGFKVSFGIVRLTPMLFLLIGFLPFSAGVRKARRAKTVGVRVSSRP